MNFLKHNELIVEINNILNNLLEQGDHSSKIGDIKTSVDDLTDRVEKLQNSAHKSPYKKIELTFYGETELKIGAVSKEFDRKLKGDMYFSIEGINTSKRFMDIKTNSFPDYLVVRLYYSKLKTNVDQRGEAQLIYDRKEGFETDVRGATKGEEKNISFKIRKLIK